MILNSLFWCFVKDINELHRVGGEDALVRLPWPQHSQWHLALWIVLLT